MLIKTILTFALSLSVLSCYADSGQSESKPLIDAQKKIQSSAQGNSQSSQPNASPTANAVESEQDKNAKEKPSMVDNCRKHTC